MLVCRAAVRVRMYYFYGRGGPSDLLEGTQKTTVFPAWDLVASKRQS